MCFSFLFASCWHLLRVIFSFDFVYKDVFVMPSLREICGGHRVAFVCLFDFHTVRVSCRNPPSYCFFFFSFPNFFLLFLLRLLLHVFHIVYSTFVITAEGIRLRANHAKLRQSIKYNKIEAITSGGRKKVDGTR